MSGDDRPRQAPRWGEYATPEEVARLRGTPPPPDPATRLPDALSGSAPSHQAPPHSVPPHPAPLRAGAPANVGTWDRPVTVALLVLGLWNVVSSFPAFIALDTALQRAWEVSGYTGTGAEFGGPTRVAGFVLLVVWVVLYLGAVGLSVERMRRRRRAFWVPLVAGAIAMFAMLVAMAVLVGVDPGLAPLLDPATVSG